MAPSGIVSHFDKVKDNWEPGAPHNTTPAVRVELPVAKIFERKLMSMLLRLFYGRLLVEWTV